MRQMRNSGCVLGGTLALLVVASSLGCGNGTLRNADGGDGPRTAPDGPGVGLRAFDVVAVLKADGSSSLPPTNMFTLVLDAGARRAIVGGNGRGRVVALVTDDDRTFRSATSFEVGDASANVCSGPESVRYDTFQVTIAGDSLTGTASGAVTISCGDCSFTVPFDATLSGTADATPPTLRASGIAPANPFDAFTLDTSEPLPTSATAKLVAEDGAVIDLVPGIVDGVVPVIVSFSKPDVVLRAGLGYVVTLDGLVDFSGQTDPAGPPLRLTSFVDAPTLPEDGFESATGSTLGGAMVITTGPLPAIAGSTSLYVGSPGAPGLDATNGRSLMVKLARQPGDTKLLFSYRVVAPQAQTGISVVLRVGSEGASPGPSVYSIGSASNSTEMLTVGGTTAFASLVAETEVALPADATDEVLVVIAPSNILCFAGGLSSAGLLIDDLRLE